MGIELVLILANLMSNEQVKTALYLDRPAAQIQVRQQYLIEQKSANTKAIIKALEDIKK